MWACVSGPLEGHLQDQWFPLGPRISSLCFHCWFAGTDWHAVVTHYTEVRPLDRVWLAPEHQLVILSNWRLRRKRQGKWRRRECQRRMYCEPDCRCDQIPPNRMTMCLMFSWSCKNKTRIYMKELELWSELNSNDEWMWQSYQERGRTMEHQAHIWFNKKWYGSNPYVRSKKPECRWQEQHNQVISHGHHSQTLPWGAGLGSNNVE